MHIDLAELRGYAYHNGIVFAAYQPGRGQALALGGRYDNLGLAFGRARPATGFSADLRVLLDLEKKAIPSRRAILAPCKGDAALGRLIARLRASGQIVVASLPGDNSDAESLGCNRRIVRSRGAWRVVRL